MYFMWLKSICYEFTLLPIFICTVLTIYTLSYGWSLELFHLVWLPSGQQLPISLPPSPWQPPLYILFLWFDCIRYLIQVESLSLPFCDWLIWLSIVSSRVICVITYDKTVFFLTLFHCMCFPHFLYLFICHRHLGCFHILAIVNYAAVNINVQRSLWDPVFSYFRHICKSRIAESYSNSNF